MTIHIGSVVELLDDIPGEGLRRGELGTVVMVFTDRVLAYEVEFCDENGVTTAELILTPDLEGVAYSVLEKK